MPTITITKDEKRDTQKRELLAPGDYQLEIIDHEFGLTQKGDDKLTIQFREVDSGNFVWSNFMFIENTVWKLKSLIKAVSGAEDGAEVDVNDELCSNMHGNKVWAYIEIDEYNGKRRNQVKRIHTEKPSSSPAEDF
jgi:phenylpyruvate tautomerase PptA (4-oxalocrotonate tautomerase family)